MYCIAIGLFLCRCGYTRRSSAADVWRDLCGGLFTLLTCSLVYFHVVTEDYSAYLDPVISLVYIAVLIWSCVPLVRDSCLILLQTIPGISFVMVRWLLHDCQKIS